MFSLLLRSICFNERKTYFLSLPTELELMNPDPGSEIFEAEDVKSRLRAVDLSNYDGLNEEGV